MSQYDNEKRLVVFVNDKGDNPKRPDYRASFRLNGVDYRASLWIATDKAGNPAKDKNGKGYMRGNIEVDDRAAGGRLPPPPTGYAYPGAQQPPGVFIPNPNHNPPASGLISEDAPF